MTKISFFYGIRQILETVIEIQEKMCYNNAGSEQWEAGKAVFLLP